MVAYKFEKLFHDEGLNFLHDNQQVNLSPPALTWAVFEEEKSIHG